ncbi:hypothetical protein D779_3642 [Imhoffiella purpurea]|uniref:Uncharacterized protein n=1 Tax=Imhoffiella purpurea TaxID=1249627 RepID=W9V227_9GAMM|nr:hypothetical protein D779_3642 [Imhoffiella purpurea]
MAVDRVAVRMEPTWMPAVPRPSDPSWTDRQETMGTVPRMRRRGNA